MKQFFKVVFVFILIVFISGCGKTYDKLSYTKYNEYFSSKDNYVILDKSSDYGSDVIRYLEAGDGNIQIFFTEYEKTEDAIKAIESAFKDNKNYKYKYTDNYTFVKGKKGRYLKLYRVDNVIVSVLTDKEYKKEANNILKDLGY